MIITRRAAARTWAAVAPAAVLGMLLLASGCAPVVIGAGAAVGATAAQERGVKGALDDTAVRADINDRWFKDDHAAYSDVNLQVQEGRVLLTGAVQAPEVRLKAVRLAWQAAGVKEVINEIEVRDSGGLTDAAQDTWISTQLRTRLIGDSAVKSRNYSIETVNGTVYLIGIAQNREELDLVIAHARNVSYVKRVVDYVRIKSDQAAS
jgi:osmotically-inducible protein OsmY